MKTTQEKRNKEFGGGLVEYGMLVGLIAVVALVSVRTLGQTLAGDDDPETQVNYAKVTMAINGSGTVLD